MNFLTFKTPLGFVLETSLSLTIGIILMILVATTIHIVKAAHKKKVLENKQRLKAEEAEKQARLDAEYFQKRARRLEERARQTENETSAEKSEKQFFSWEDFLKEENEHEWLEYIG